MDENKHLSINFQTFSQLATDKNLSKYEKIGFPNSYREGFEKIIFLDILSKLTNLKNKKKEVVDIGPGCSELPNMLIEKCRQNNHNLTLIDNEEMLNLLPSNDSRITKVAALFPNCNELIQRLEGTVDAVLCYSVLQYIIIDTAFFKFLDYSLSLLAPGGQMLIGDIPNSSKRKRFFSSKTGVRFHQEFMKTENLPEVEFNRIEHGLIDDSVIFAILQRARIQGFDAYIVPQGPSLPMANRREDILIIRP